VRGDHNRAEREEEDVLVGLAQLGVVVEHLTFGDGAALSEAVIDS
jgi:hypothetical protein